MRTTGADAVAVLDSEQRARAVLTARSFFKWIEEGGGDAREPVATLFDSAPPAIAADAPVSDGVLAMGAADADALTLTSDGTKNGQVHAIVTSRDLAHIFGDQPVEILREISRAADTDTLRELNQRARSLVLRYLTNAASSDWLAGFTSRVDANIVGRVIAIAVPEELPVCWCFCGSSGRGESLTRLAPQLVMIVDEGEEQPRSLDAYQRVLDLLDECDYLPNVDRPFAPSFYAASLAEWRQRYYDWVSDPILKEIYRARPLFDLRHIHGRESIWQELEATVTRAVNRAFLHVLANDCLASLPPLTFFQDAVVDETGAETAVFRLEHSALRPLVDVGRVFGLAARKVFGNSTLERFAMARTMLPQHASIFREASETLRIVLWQQSRVGITQGTAGSELPPALLSRYDRQILRSGFRSILQLLEFTADLTWLKTL
jgi:CBS domain-containing protein